MLFKIVYTCKMSLEDVRIYLGVASMLRKSEVATGLLIGFSATWENENQSCISRALFVLN